MNVLNTIGCVLGALIVTPLFCVFIFLPIMFIMGKFTDIYLAMLSKGWDSLAYKLRERKKKKAVMIKEKEEYEELQRLSKDTIRYDNVTIGESLNEYNKRYRC